MPDKSKKKDRRGGARPGSGPNPKPEYGEYLTERFDLRLTKPQYQHVESRATAAGISMAEYVRKLIDADMATGSPAAPDASP